MAQRNTSLRYRTACNEQGAFQPGSSGRVLRNFCGITHKLDIDAAEFKALVAAQETYLSLVGPDTRITSALLCQMHRDWLGSLYPWAGCYRTVELAKGHFKWPPAYLVEQNMRVFELETLACFTPCRFDSPDDLLHSLAVVHAELLLIHPFREGNGRLARWVADLMAAQAGVPMPSYQFTGRDAKLQRTTYLEAVQRGYAGDYQPLALFFARALERGRGS